MNKTFTLLALCLLAFSVKAQNAAPTYQLYGKVDKEDLELKACDFETDAIAEVLIDKGDLYYDTQFNQILDCHRRIKIFNDNGKDHANIRIPFVSADRQEYITGLQGETINITDGKVEITKLDKKLVYTQVVDKYNSALVFTMPNVKPGSIIEYKYTVTSSVFYRVPAWFFQDRIPVRYSEYDTSIPEWLYFQSQAKMRVPFTSDAKSQGNGSYGIGQDATTYTTEIEKRTLVDIPSLPDEPFMSSVADNLERVSFQLTSFRPPNGFVQNSSDSWEKVATQLIEDEDFGKQVNRKLNGEEVITGKAKSLKTDDEKIAYVFNEVKNSMKWDGDDQWYTNDGTREAWDKKTGNSTEINLILYHLLNKSGVKAFPMVVSTRDNGKVNPAYTYLKQFNRAVVYIPIDSTRYYVLDAAGKYNMYNETPFYLLNSSGFYVDMDKKTSDMIFLNKVTPVRRSVFIIADIKPDGKMEGTAQISSFSYNRINGVTRYKTDGETKYIDYLRDDDNNLKVSSLKMENMDVDTLPLIQNVSFNLDLAGSDDNYIYFNPNLFTLLHKNPFLNEKRSTDIDFGYLDNLAINGQFKIPAGYKVDALPKNISMTNPDKSITFRRIVGEQDGAVVVRYTINYKKSIYFKEDYADFHEFYKKMYEMLNEQIVLKKG